MSKAKTCIARASARGITIAQSANDMGATTDTVDDMYKFYHFSDGSKIGTKFTDKPGNTRWPSDKTQYWEVC